MNKRHNTSLECTISRLEWARNWELERAVEAAAAGDTDTATRSTGYAASYAESIASHKTYLASKGR